MAQLIPAAASESSPAAAFLPSPPSAATLAGMADVHPTAVVDRRSVLGEGVRIGPGCVLEGRVELGENVRLGPRVSMKGPLVVGRANRFQAGSCIGYEPQDRGFDPRLEGAGVVIGEGNLFRQGVTIHRATGERPTRIGDRNILLVHTHVAHDVRLGSGCTLGSGAMLAGHVRVDDDVVLRPNGLVHQFCRVGRLAIIQSNGGPTQDAPPFYVVAALRRGGSLNLAGLRRAGCARHVEPLRAAFDLLYHSRQTLPRAVRRIERQLGDDPLCAELAAFIRSSRRGIVRPARSASKESTKRKKKN